MSQCLPGVPTLVNEIRFQIVCFHVWSRLLSVEVLSRVAGPRIEHQVPYWSKKTDVLLQIYSWTYVYTLMLLRSRNFATNCRTEFGFEAHSKNSEKRLLASSCLSVRMDNSASTGRIFTKFDIRGIFENLLRKLKLY